MKTLNELLLTADPPAYRSLLLEVYPIYVEHGLFWDMDPPLREKASFFILSLCELLNTDGEGLPERLARFLQIHDDHAFCREVLGDMLTAWVGSNGWCDVRLTSDFSASGEVVAITKLLNLFN